MVTCLVLAVGFQLSPAVVHTAPSGGVKVLVGESVSPVAVHVDPSGGVKPPPPPAGVPQVKTPRELSALAYWPAVQVPPSGVPLKVSAWVRFSPVEVKKLPSGNVSCVVTVRLFVVSPVEVHVPPLGPVTVP